MLVMRDSLLYFEDYQEFDKFNSSLEEPFYSLYDLKQMGLEPLDPYDYLQFTIHDKKFRRNFFDDFYSLSNSCKIRKNPVEVSDSRIAASLYIINKKAKEDRDEISSFSLSKADYYRRRGRKDDLYFLKDRVLEKLDSEGKLKVLGYHTVDGDRWHRYICYGFEGFTYHMRVDKSDSRCKGLEDLGALTNWISSKRSVKTSMRYTTAVRVLHAYLKSK